MINPNTVAKAYAELTAEGWLESRQGLGLFVAPPRQRLSRAERDKRFDEAVNRFVHEVIALDVPSDEVLARLDTELRACALSPVGVPTTSAKGRLAATRPVTDQRHFTLPAYAHLF